VHSGSRAGWDALQKAQRLLESRYWLGEAAVHLWPEGDAVGGGRFCALLGVMMGASRLAHRLSCCEVDGRCISSVRRSGKEVSER